MSSSSTMAFLIAVSGLSFFFELNFLAAVGLGGAMLVAACTLHDLLTLIVLLGDDDQQS